MAETMITIRVPKEMKERMRKAELNWSLEIRRAIEARLEDDRRVKANAELNELLRHVKPGFNSALSIREDRDND